MSSNPNEGTQTMTTINQVARQGDVLLVRIGELPDGTSPTKRDEHGRIVLAYGEHSGHAHALRDPHVMSYRASDSGEVDYIEVGGSGPATLSHEYVSGQMADHLPITLAPGVYKVVRQREYSPEAIKRVVD